MTRTPFRKRIFLPRSALDHTVENKHFHPASTNVILQDSLKDEQAVIPWSHLGFDIVTKGAQPLKQ